MSVVRLIQVGLGRSSPFGRHRRHHLLQTAESLCGEIADAKRRRRAYSVARVGAPHEDGRDTNYGVHRRCLDSAASRLPALSLRNTRMLPGLVRRTA
jgi:hypothetical protein